MYDNETMKKLEFADPELYNALRILADRLNLVDLTKQVVESITPKMKVKELHNILFSGQKVKLVHQGDVLFTGYANELPYCYFKDSEVRTMSTVPSCGNEISIVLERIIKPLG